MPVSRTVDENESDDVGDRLSYRESRPLAQDQNELLQAAFGELEIIRVESGGDCILSHRLANLERLLEKMELLNRATLMVSRTLPLKSRNFGGRL